MSKATSIRRPRTAPAKASTNAAQVRAEALKSGAAALYRLMHSIGDVSNATVFRHGEDCDGRDYRTLVGMVEQSIDRHVAHSASDHREGYLRALAVLLCMGIDGMVPDLNALDPIVETAQAFGEVQS